MQAFTCLELFLANDLNYAAGVADAGLSPESFRNRVYTDILMLSRVFQVSFHPLRLQHLRLQAAAMQDLLYLYQQTDTIP